MLIIVDLHFYVCVSPCRTHGAMSSSQELLQDDGVSYDEILEAFDQAPEANGGPPVFEGVTRQGRSIALGSRSTIFQWR